MSASRFEESREEILAPSSSPLNQRRKPESGKEQRSSVQHGSVSTSSGCLSGDRNFHSRQSGLYWMRNRQFTDTLPVRWSSRSSGLPTPDRCAGGGLSSRIARVDW